MFHISISLTLLALVAGTFLLYKAKKDMLGNFAKWVAYLVIVFSFVMLVMDITHGVMRLMHCGGEMGGHGMEQCAPGMCGGMQCGHGEMGHEGCMHEGGKMHGGKCCDEDMEHGKKGGCDDMEEHHEGMHGDTTVKK